MKKGNIKDQYIVSIKFYPKFICGRESMYSIVGKEIQREKVTRGV